MRPITVDRLPKIVYRTTKNVKRTTSNEKRKTKIEHRITNNEQRTKTMESNLEVWKLSHQLVLSIYKITENYPKSEQFGLVSQIRRSAVSIPTNIIEGQARQYKKEFIQFLYIAKGSLEETNYHLLLSKDLGFITEQTYQELSEICIRIKMMLYKLIKSMQTER